MTLVEQIMHAYPELTLDDFGPVKRTIIVQDDADGGGPYIQQWNYANPVPAGIAVGKPNA